MNHEPRFSDDDGEAIQFEATVNGRPLLIAVDREAIEDHLRRESTSPEERLQFVRTNRQRLINAAQRQVGSQTDITGILLKEDQLSECPR